MKKILILFLLTGIIYSASSQSMKFSWIEQLGSANWDVVTSMTELSDGKIALAGAFYDSITIAGKTYFSNGSRDCFIAIFDQHGEFTNTLTLGGDGYEYIRNLLPAENGGLSAVLQYNDKLQTGGHTFLKKGQNNYAFVFFDKNLNIGNKTIIGSKGESKITGYEKSSDGSYYFTGWFEDSLMVDNKYYVTKGDENVFAGSIAKEAKMNWFKHYETNGFDRSFVSKADKSGKNYMVGITGKGEFEGQKKPKKANEEFTNLFVLENNNEGVISGINYPVYGHEIEPVGILNDSTNLWILVNFKYSAFVNSMELKSYGMSDILLLKINKQTKETNYYHFEGIGNEIAAGLVKSGNQVIVAGSFTNEIIFAGYTAKPDDYGPDVFVAAFDENCTPVSLITLKGDKSEFPCSIISSGTGIYLTGEFTGSLSVDGFKLTSQGNEDIFIARIENCSSRQPLQITVTDYAIGKNKAGWKLDAGEGFKEYSWDDNLSNTRDLIVSNQGVYKVTVVDKSGCVYTDSVNVMPEKSGTIIENTETHPFRLYPTLTNNKVFWVPSSDWISLPASIKVFDISGKVVKQRDMKQILDTEYEIDFSSHPEGAYVVEISGSGFRTTSKIVLKK